MSCAYRFHRYRASVTAHPASVSWQPPTGHARHPIPLHPLVVHPGHHLATRTEPPADDTPVSLSLVQYLWSQWQVSPSERDTIAAAIGELMLSPRWHWDVTVLPDQSPPDPQRSFVSEHAGRPTIGMPITMLRDLWTWVLGNTSQRAPILRRFASGITPSLWQELRTHQLAHGRRLTEREWYLLYRYLSPVLLPDIVRETRHLLSSDNPTDQQMALIILDWWMASDDHATRDLAAQMLHAWLNQQAAASPTNDQLRLQAIMILSSSDTPTVVSERLYDLLRTAWNRITPGDVRTVIDLLDGRGDGRPLATDRWMSLLGEMVRVHPSEEVIREVLDRLMPTILPSDRPDDRVRWVTTLWTLMTDSTLPKRRRQTIATALKQMMQDPMVAALVHAQLCTEPSRLQTIPAPICDTLLAGLIQTAHADAVLRIIAQTIRQDRLAIARFDPIVAAGWGHGHDHRILQFITSNPSPYWQTALAQGITTSVGAEVCARIGSWFPRDEAMALIMRHIHDRERREDWPLAPLPAHLIPWVGEAARTCPYRLHPTTIRRLWRADPDHAWNATQTMLHSDYPVDQQRAIAAMDAGWDTGYAVEVATTLRARILERQADRNGIETGIHTVVAGIGTVPPSIMESLLTELATSGNTDVQRWLIRELRRGWGRGQDALMMHALETMGEPGTSEEIWSDSRETLIRAWGYQPPHVVGSLVDRLVTRATNRLAKDGSSSPLGPREVQQIIAAFAPGWTHLPATHMIERIAHHVAHLHAHAHTLDPSSRDTLVSAWASVVTAGAARLSAADIHAVLDSLWDISPDGCLTGVAQWVRRR